METHARAVAQRRASGSRSSRASKRRVGSNAPRLGQRVAARDVRHVDAAEVDRDAPAGSADALRRPCTCRPRTLTRGAARQHHQLLSFASAPDTSVPVTTVPNPFIENTRSIGSRAGPSARRAGTDAAIDASVVRQRRRARRRSSPTPRHRRVGEKRSRHELAHLEARQLQRLGVDAGRSW